MGRLPKIPRVNLPGFIKPRPEGLSHDEMRVLLDFQSGGSKTLGQILSSNGLRGSRVMESIERLNDFGFIRRDWKKEIELSVDVVYSLTDFGREMIRRTAGKG